jgi:hypothetical protein
LVGFSKRLWVGLGTFERLGRRCGRWNSAVVGGDEIRVRSFCQVMGQDERRMAGFDRRIVSGATGEDRNHDERSHRPRR